MAYMGRMKEFIKKYGKVAMGVHFSVSAVSITGLYIAIRNNVDVESLLHKVGISGVFSKDKEELNRIKETKDEFIGEEMQYHQQKTTTMVMNEKEKRNGSAELAAASSGGALALAILCDKALLPVRVPITLILTPPVAKFLARRRIR